MRRVKISMASILSVIEQISALGSRQAFVYTVLNGLIVMYTT